MKKIIALAIALVSLASFSAYAADVKASAKQAKADISASLHTASPRAVGIRVGYGLSVNYQHTVTDNSFLSADLDVPGFQGIGVTVTYDFLNPFNTAIPWNHAGRWDWYLGAGLGVGGMFLGYGYVGVAGRVGVEYSFDKAPIRLAAEWRPAFGPAFDKYSVAFFTPGLWAGAISLCVRYAF